MSLSLRRCTIFGIEAENSHLVLNLFHRCSLNCLDEEVQVGQIIRLALFVAILAKATVVILSFAVRLVDALVLVTVDQASLLDLLFLRLPSESR